MTPYSSKSQHSSKSIQFSIKDLLKKNNSIRVTLSKSLSLQNQLYQIHDIPTLPSSIKHTLSKPLNPQHSKDNQFSITSINQKHSNKGIQLSIKDPQFSLDLNVEGSTLSALSLPSPHSLSFI